MRPYTVGGLAPGVYKYLPLSHALQPLAGGLLRRILTDVESTVQVRACLCAFTRNTSHTTPDAPLAAGGTDFVYDVEVMSETLISSQLTCLHLDCN